MNYLNIASYKFIALTPDKLADLQASFKKQARGLNLYGTILLSPEGINLMLAGSPDAIKIFQDYLNTIPEFLDLIYKENFSEIKPFRKLLIKIKQEIIAFKIPSIDPVNHTAPYINASELQALLKDKAANSDNIVLLDTRNTYEIDCGTFLNAQHLNIEQFSDFPEAAKKLDPDLKNKTVITFCTGGIRCEKAALLLQEYGFKDVYQLQGGILEYFNQCGSDEFYQGKCYVFDERTAV